MKRLIMIAAMIAAFGLGGAAAFAGTSDKPPSPPGQDECEHGNSQKPCKDDPQPDKGKDCDEHGNSGGVNEDHCKNETTPPPPPPGTVEVCLNGVIVTAPEGTVGDGSCETITTTTTETETTTDTTSTGTTPAETTPAETSPEETTVTETTSTEPASSPEEESQVFTPPSKKPVKVAAITASVAKPSNDPQPAPFTP
jgi:hypothetical protein